MKPKQLKQVDDYLKHHPKISWFFTTIAPSLTTFWWIFWSLKYNMPEAAIWAFIGILFGWGIAYFNKRYGADQVQKLNNKAEQ